MWSWPSKYLPVTRIFLLHTEGRIWGDEHIITESLTASCWRSCCFMFICPEFYSTSMDVCILFHCWRVIDVSRNFWHFSFPIMSPHLPPVPYILRNWTFFFFFLQMREVGSYYSLVSALGSWNPVFLALNTFLPSTYSAAITFIVSYSRIFF